MADKPAATGSGEPKWMHDVASRINEIQAMRGHVLRAANGDTNPVMPEAEMVGIMQQYAATTPPASQPTVTLTHDQRSLHRGHLANGVEVAEAVCA